MCIRDRPERFTDRYVFPDGELAPVTRVAAAGALAGLEIAHVENLRPSYAYTLRDWGANLVRCWDACVAEVGVPTAKVWGAYMAGSRLGFEQNWFQLHQVLFARPEHGGEPGYACLLYTSTGAGEPPAILQALSDRRREKHGVTVAQILPLRRFDYIDPETVQNVRHTAYFLNAPTRAAAQEGLSLIHI